MIMPEPQDKQDQKTDQSQQQDPNNEQWRSVAEVKKIIADRDNYKKEFLSLKEKVGEFDQLKQELEGYRSEKAKIQQEAERKKLESAGEYQKIIEQNNQRHAQELQTINNRFTNKLVPAAIRDAALKVPSILPNAIDDLIPIVKDSIGIDNEFNVYVKNDEGKPKLGDDGKPLSVDTYLASYVKTRPWFLSDNQPTNKGLKPGQISDGQKTKTLNEMNDKERAAYREADPAGYEQAVKQEMDPTLQVQRAREALQKRQSLADQLGKRMT